MVGEDDILNKKSKIDMARLPPCQDSLIPHIERVNYRVSCYRRANVPIFDKPNPYDSGQGWILENGVLQPLWSKSDVLPQSLVEILDRHIDKTDTLDDSDDEEVELEIDDDFDDES